MTLEDIKNIVTIVAGIVAVIAVIVSIKTYVKHKERYLQQKAYEWSINQVMEYLELTEKCWKQSTKTQGYIGYLAIVEKWSLEKERLHSPEQVKNYEDLKKMLLDLFYFFNNTNNPLVLLAINKKQMIECFNLVEKYEPFTLSTFVELEKDKNFKNLQNDLLKIQKVIQESLAKKLNGKK